MKARACWNIGPKQAEIRDMAMPTIVPGSSQVLVQTLYSAISRGTETTVFAGRVPPTEHQRMRAPFQEGEFSGDVKYGYINVGRVLAGPAELIRKTVFCLYPHQTHYCVDATAVTVVPTEVPPERAVLAAGMETALNGLWDAVPKLGDRIAIVGGGVIGMLCAYLAARIVGCQVELVDVNPERGPVAAQLGVGFATPDTARVDADLVLHASGSSAGLQTALKLAGCAARIVELSWYGDTEVHLPLGQSFHSQRLTLMSSQVGQIPESQASRWDYKRRMRCALALLRDPILDILMSGESEFSDLPKTLASITAHPGPLCHRIVYPGHGIP